MGRSLPDSGLRAAALLAVVAACVSAPEASAQRSCRFVDPTANVQGVTIAGLGMVYYVSRPSISCADGVFMRADSAVAYPSQNRTELMGNVRFRDEFRELRSDEARYFSQLARLQASGHLFVLDTIRGSQIENGSLVLLRRTEFRSEEEMTVTRDRGVRPRARLYLQPASDTTAADTVVADVQLPLADSLPQADTLGAAVDTAAVSAAAVPAPPPEPDTVPFVVEAERLFLRGEGTFQAYGTVEITRDSLRAFSDSTRYDQMAGVILLQGSARVDGDGYDLTGRDIDLGVPEGSVQSVRAIRDAVLTGDRLRLTSPVIEVFLTDGAMDRLIAVPLRPLPGMAAPLEGSELSKPVAVAEDFTLTADSIEVVAPAQELDHITAVGGARGVSTARDSLNVDDLPEIARNDWLEGDTVVATFVRIETAEDEPADTAAARYQLDRLVANGEARSLYRMEPSDTTSRPGVDKPAVHYVTGAVIVIVLADGQVERMEVEGPTRGWHLEPVVRAPRDTLTVSDTIVVDSASARRDTARVPPDTSRAMQAGSGSSDPPGRQPPARPIPTDPRPRIPTDASVTGGRPRRRR
jgi:hypothetical protein